MKANAPERIWIDPVNDLPKLSGHIDKDSVEYTRTDDFIEKACDFFDEHLLEYIDVKANCDTFINIDGDKFIEDFRKYMEGE